MPKFKVGDAIRVITNEHGHEQFGREGIITNIRDPWPTDFLYEVTYTGAHRGQNVYRIGDIELIGILPNGFRVGDRVFYVEDDGGVEKRIYGTVKQQPRAIIGVEEDKAVWAQWDHDGQIPGAEGFMFVKDVFLAAPDDELPIPVDAGVPFVFIQEVNTIQTGKLGVGHLRGLESFKSVEAAMAHCAKLRAQHGPRVVAYVRVE